MKKTLRIGIASYEEMKARTIAIAKGKHKSGKDEPKVWFTSIESFAKVLSEKNRALLEVIAEAEGLTLTELAEKTGREKSNLSPSIFRVTAGVKSYQFERGYGNKAGKDP